MRIGECVFILSTRTQDNTSGLEMSEACQRSAQSRFA